MRTSGVQRVPTRAVLVCILARSGSDEIPLHREGPDRHSPDSGVVPGTAAENDPIGLCRERASGADNEGMKHNRNHASCPTCGAPGLLRVSLNMEDGAVSYWTCAECETSGWKRGDGIVTRESALANIPRR